MHCLPPAAGGSAVFKAGVKPAPWEQAGREGRTRGVHAARALASCPSGPPEAGQAPTDRRTHWWGQAPAQELCGWLLGLEEPSQDEPQGRAAAPLPPAMGAPRARGPQGTPRPPEPVRAPRPGEACPSALCSPGVSMATLCLSVRPSEETEAGSGSPAPPPCRGSSIFPGNGAGPGGTRARRRGGADNEPCVPLRLQPSARPAALGRDQAPSRGPRTEPPCSCPTRRLCLHRPRAGLVGLERRTAESRLCRRRTRGSAARPAWTRCPVHGPSFSQDRLRLARPSGHLVWPGHDVGSVAR